MSNKVINLLIYSYVVLLPIFPSKFRFGLVPFNGDIILGMLIVFYTFGLISNKNNWRSFKIYIRDFFSNKFSIFVSLLLIVMYFSIIYATYRKAAVIESLRFSTYVFLYFVIKYETNTKKKVDNILKCFIVTSIILCLVGFVQYFTKVGLGEFVYIEGLTTRVRVPSTLGNPNSFGGFLVLCAFPIAMMAINEKKKKIKTIYILTFLAIFINLLLTQSRSALIGFIIGSVAITLIYNIRLLFVFFFLGMIPFFIPQILNRFKDLNNIVQNEGRVQLWKLAYKMIKDHPILGIGNGNYFKLYKDYIIKYPELDYNHHTEFTVHNNYLKVQSELGILGTIGFSGMIITAIIRLKKLTNENIDIRYIAFFKGVTASFIAFAFMNLSDDFFLVPKITSYFWILIASAEAIQYRIHEYRN